MQAVGQALEPVAEPVEVPRGRGLGTGFHVVVGDQLSDRGHKHARDPFRRELRGWHELAHRLDLVAPILDADRPARGSGEDVDDATADRELAAVLAANGVQSTRRFADGSATAARHCKNTLMRESNG